MHDDAKGPDICLLGMRVVQDDFRRAIGESAKRVLALFVRQEHQSQSKIYKFSDSLSWLPWCCSIFLIHKDILHLNISVHHTQLVM
jgi:hypothetical protein